MSPTVANLLALLAIVSSILYFIKSREKRDYTYLASALSRLYLAGVMFSVGNFSQLLQVKMDDALVAWGAVVLSDIVVICIYLFGRKYLKEIEHAKTINRLKDMSEKFSVIVESAITGFFTIDKDGNIEFVNQSLATLLGYQRSELVGKNLFSYLEDPCLKDIFCQERFTCPTTNIKTKSGKLLSVHISGGKTRNGHETITGSIIELA